MIFISHRVHKARHKGFIVPVTLCGKNTLYTLALTLLLFPFSPLPLFSQLSLGGQPESFKYPAPVDLPAISLPAPDLVSIREQDVEDEKQAMPRRVGVEVPADVDFPGDWRYEFLPDGTRIWRVALVCEGALGMSVRFDDFRMTDGSRLYLYNQERVGLLGAYTTINNRENRVFATEIVPGDKLVLEMEVDAGSGSLPALSVSGISYVYRDLPDFKRFTGDSDDCEVNINCPEGESWQKQKRSVARIYVKDGAGYFWCTGSLLNNARMDREPFFLTADHCAANVPEEDLAEWIFYFNYEGPGCEDPVNTPSAGTLTGAVKLANADTNGSDFLLLLLNDEVPESYEPYYNGWTTENISSPSGVTIHHPMGDIKKISTYTEPLISSQWGSTPNTHWEVTWSATESGWGVTEGGSSGSPLFDNSGRLIGMLTGGFAACDAGGGGTGPDKPDYYGKFSFSWDQNGTTPDRQIKYWLDPENTGITSLAGMNASLTANFIADRTILLTGNSVVFTNLSSGLPVSWEWTFEGGNPGSYSGQVPPDIEYANGGTYDVRLIVSDGLKFDTLYQKDYIQVVGTVYPNPASEEVNIYLDTDMPSPVKAEVYNVVGQRVLKEEFPNQSFKLVTVDISRLNAGIYIVRLEYKTRFLFAKIMVNR